MTLNVLQTSQYIPTWTISSVFPNGLSPTIQPPLLPAYTFTNFPVNNIQPVENSFPTLSAITHIVLFCTISSPFSPKWFLLDQLHFLFPRKTKTLMKNWLIFSKPSPLTKLLQKVWVNWYCWSSSVRRSSQISKPASRAAYQRVHDVT